MGEESHTNDSQSIKPKDEIQIMILHKPLRAAQRSHDWGGLYVGQNYISWFYYSGYTLPQVNS